MTENEIKELNIHEVYYILLNEKNLYTSKEIAMLEQRKKELDIKYKEEEYIEEVKNGSFPSEEHGFKIDEEVIEKLY